MKEVTVSGKVTLEQIAGMTGASYRTVALYAQKAGWTENGKQTLLDQRQMTVILEAMKAPVSSGTKSNLASQLQGTETAQSVKTLETISNESGLAYSTVTKAASDLGYTQNGKKTLLTEEQENRLKEKLIANSLHTGNTNSDLLIRLEADPQLRVLQLQAALDEIRKKRIKELEERLSVAEQRAAEDAPKVKAWKRCLDAEGYLDFQQTAAVLNIRGLGRNNLFELLRRDGVLTRRNIPYRNYIETGYFRVIETTGYDQYGEEHINTKTLVHQKGIEFILRLVYKKRPETVTATASAGEALF
jgi:phage antirepressor YoqD-like protein